MAGASIFDPDTSQWRLSTSYSYLDLEGQAAKLAIFVTIRRHIVVKISAFLILLLNCGWIPSFKTAGKDTQELYNQGLLRWLCCT
jgi:hypothetical protein